MEEGEGRPGSSAKFRIYFIRANAVQMTLSGLLKRECVAGTAVPLLDCLQHSRWTLTLRSVARNRAVQYEGLSEQDTPDIGQGGAPETGFRMSPGVLN